MIYHQCYSDLKDQQTTVVLLHAFPLNSRMWEPQIHALLTENIPFLALDFPGFGRSRDWEKIPTMVDFAEEAYLTIKRLSLPKAVVVGLSMGGYVALSLYKEHPEIFEGLVLANTKATADTEEAKQSRYNLIEQIRNDPSMERLIRMHIEKFYTKETRSYKPELTTLAKSLIKEATPGGVIHALKAMASRPDSTDLLRKMNTRVLVIAGENDPLVPGSDVQSMVDNLKNREVVVIPNAAHLSNIENPEAFNKSLISFLKTAVK